MASGVVAAAVLGGSPWASNALPALATPAEAGPAAIPTRADIALSATSIPNARPAAQPTPVVHLVRAEPAPVAAPVAAVAGSDTDAPAAPDATAEQPPDPAVTVARFYQLLQAGDFDDITLLMSARLQDALGWSPNLMRQRTPPGHLTINRNAVVGHDVAYRQATVAVDVLEHTEVPLMSTVHYVGTWQLVRGPSGWQLDASNILAERE
jgi:hypothetical protein